MTQAASTYMSICIDVEGHTTPPLSVRSKSPRLAKMPTSSCTRFTSRSIKRASSRTDNAPLPCAARAISQRFSVSCPKKWPGLSKLSSSPWYFFGFGRWRHGTQGAFPIGLQGDGEVTICHGVLLAATAAIKPSINWSMPVKVVGISMPTCGQYCQRVGTLASAMTRKIKIQCLESAGRLARWLVTLKNYAEADTHIRKNVPSRKTLCC